MIKMPITRQKEWLALSKSFARIGRLDFDPNHESRKDRGLTLFEYVIQMAQSIGAEIAVAKYFGDENFDPTVDTFKREADVGSQIEVKWTLWQDGHLILNGTDRPQDVAILVVNKAPNYVLAGWIPIAMAMREKYRRGDGSYWIPQTDLQPIENLRSSNYGDTFL
jgi:hypothetical protein